MYTRLYEDEQGLNASWVSDKWCQMTYCIILEDGDERHSVSCVLEDDDKRIYCICVYYIYIEDSDERHIIGCFKQVAIKDTLNYCILHYNMTKWKKTNVITNYGERHIVKLL